MKSYFIFRNGRQEGPYDVNTILGMRLSGDTLVWCDGMADWKPISAVAELVQPDNGFRQGSQNRTGATPPYNGTPPYRQAYSQYPMVSDKNRITTAILALFLGGLGIHYFYIGKSTAGIVFLLLCCTGIPALLAFIQGIIMLTMTDDQFIAKYVNTPSTFPMF